MVCSLLIQLLPLHGKGCSESTSHSFGLCEHFSMSDAHVLQNNNSQQHLCACLYTASPIITEIKIHVIFPRMVFKIPYP